MRLMNEAIDRVSTGGWISRVQHVEQIQDEGFHKGLSRDEVIQRIAINSKE
jgi:hypothetical protein